MDIQESSHEDSATFNFLGITWESKRSWRNHFSFLFKIFLHHGAASKIYWLCYKPLVLNYSGFGTRTRTHELGKTMFVNYCKYLNHVSTL